ncbi:MAG: hypothetical protein OXG97_00585 [Candidatus Poribacteria bacterium]|nr:hypothetical protein [Candidatus Poribacteria bacterium]
MEHQISQLIQKYHHKANSQGQARIKHTNSTEMIRAVLNAPEDSTTQLVTQVKKNMGVSELPFRVDHWLEDNQLHGRNRFEGQEKRIEWTKRVTQTAQDLQDFVFKNTDAYDCRALYEQVKSVGDGRPRLAHKAILYVFSTEIPDAVIYKSLLEKTARLANFNQAKALVQEIVELIAIEKGFVKKKSAHERVIGGIAGTRSLIQSLTRESELIDDANIKSFSEQEQIAHENDDLRAAAEIAQHQLEALQEEIEHIRDEAKQEVVITFFQEMNSGQHSNLLDQFLKADLLVRQLKKQGTEIPQDIELIPTLIRMFTRFVKTQGIRPKAVVGQQKVITLSESDEYEYTGSSWEDPDERKTVEIQSAGWIYGNTLISKPKVKEVTS